MEYQTIMEFVNEYKEFVTLVSIGAFVYWGYLLDKNNKELNGSDKVNLKDIRNSLEKTFRKSL